MCFPVLRCTSLYLLTGYEGNSKFIDSEIPTIVGISVSLNLVGISVSINLLFPEYLVNKKCFIIPKETSDAK